MRALRFVVVASLCTLAVGCGGKKRVRKMGEASQTIMATNKESDIRALCMKPEAHRNAWNAMVVDKAGQTAACEWLEQYNAEAMVKVQADAQALGGVACLQRLQTHWADTTHRDEWRLPGESDELRRAQLSKIAEPCIVTLEARAAVEPPAPLFLEFFGHESLFRGPALTAEQHARLVPALKDVQLGAMKAWEARGATLLTDQPLASALYLTSAAVAANAAKDTAVRDALLKRALDATHAAGAPDKLSVTLTGDLADKVKTAAGEHYVFADKGELQLALALTAPSIEYGQRSVTHHGTRQVSNGMKPNPNFVSAKRACDKQGAEADNQEASCRRDNGKSGPDGFAGVCMWARKYRQRTIDCQAQLGRVTQQVEDVRDERIDYPAVEFFADAKGALTITAPGAAPQQVALTASSTNTKHGEVPALGLSASSGSKVSAAAIEASYQGRAVSTITDLLEAGRSGLRKKLSDQVTAADADASATALVRLCLVTGVAPDGKLLNQQDSKYGVPTARAVAVLVAASSKNKRVAW